MGKRVVLTLTLLALLAYAGAVLVAYSFQRQLLYWPNRTITLDAPGYTRLAIKTEDGISLVGWYAPPTTLSITILFFHGNAGSPLLPGRLDKIATYRDLGYGIYIASYRGWNGNPGTPSEEGLYADARAAVMALKQQGVLPQNIIVNGESLGTGVAIHIALEFPFKALILENPYTSIPAVAQNHYKFLPAYWLVKDRFDNLTKITKITVPTLILSAQNDTTVPPAMGQTLAAANTRWVKSVILEGAEHNNLYHYGAFAAVHSFLKSLP
ncbi:MAG: alpha/beta hydrolase [Alphaproteobacteria bacterium]